MTIVLSPRQRDVAERVCRHDESYAEAGRTLGIHEQTVKNHLLAAYRKCGVASKSGFCFRYGRDESHTIASKVPALRSSEV